MIESGGYKRFDALVVVHCDPEVQISRLMRRNGLTRDPVRVEAHGAQLREHAHHRALADRDAACETDLQHG